MPSTIHTFFATIDPGSPPPQQLGLEAAEVEAPGTAPGSARSPL